MSSTVRVTQRGERVARSASARPGGVLSRCARTDRDRRPGAFLEHFDVVGSGLGPFNLSLAALVEPITEVKVRFFEAHGTFQWHSGMMLPGARLQVSFLKDLVTLVDPSS